PPSTPPPGGTYTPPPPPPPPPVGGAAPGSDRTVMIVLSYLSILCLIPLLTKKDDPEVQWHAKNGLAFVVFDIVVWIVLAIVTRVAAHIPIFGCGIATILSVLWCVVWVGILVIHVVAIIKGVNGQRFRLPVVSDFADKM
ncbi:MAG TPA: DUF4870 domain-containing protein, partial [Thermoanaerobaculia bacterium]|nr:DUF4870 domain-containing protein [Thermoanaerobaculia bacterium]